MSVAPPSYDFNTLLSPAFSKAMKDDQVQELPNLSIPIDIFKIDVNKFLDECDKIAAEKTQPRKIEKANVAVLQTIKATTRKPLSSLNSNAIEARTKARGKKSFVELSQPPAISRGLYKKNLFF